MKSPSNQTNDHSNEQQPRLGAEHAELKSLRSRVASLEKELHQVRIQHQEQLDRQWDVIYEVDLEGKISYVNASVERVMGHLPKDVIGTGFLSWIAKDWQEEIRKQHELVLQGECFVGETVILDKEGRRHNAEFIDSPILQEGSVVGTYGVIRDTTEHRQAVSQAQVAESRYQGLFETTCSGVGIYEAIGNGEDFIFKDINPAGERIGGVHRQDVLGRSISDVFPKAKENGTIGALHDVWLSGKSNYLPPRKYVHGQLKIWTEIHTFKLDSGEFIQIYNTTTELVKTREALEESESTYRTLVESAAEEIGALDTHGTILFANRRLGDNLGLPPEALVDKTLWDLFPKSIAEYKAGLIRQVVESGEGQTVTIPSEYQGKSRWQEVTIVPLHQELDQIRSVMFIGRNITEIVELQDQLEIYREQMVQAERLASAGLLSAMVAHEVAQPATVIRLSIQNALAQLTQHNQEIWHQDLQESLQEIDRLSELIQRFRDIAHIRPEQHYESVCMKTIIEKNMRLMESLCRRQQVEMNLNHADKLIPIHADAGDMEQLCFILIENCLHAADAQTVNILDIDCDATEDRIELQFSDNCGGIASEHIDHIFEPFFTTKPAAKGTGLGLCIAERIVNNINGSIQINNRPGHGVSFCISLPSTLE